MKDMTGKEIKAGMCLEIVYGDGNGTGVGEIFEKDGELGFKDFWSNEFYKLSDLDKDYIKRLLIVKE